jgi:hypothetical protein
LFLLQVGCALRREKIGLLMAASGTLLVAAKTTA